LHRFIIASLSAALALFLVLGVVGQSSAKISSSRSERCSRLGRQLEETIETQAATKQVTAVKALQKKAMRLCANKKQAQGIRAFANALKLLGATPIDPDSATLNPDPRKKETKS
jgi:hypothetical protein